MPKRTTTQFFRVQKASNGQNVGAGAFSKRSDPSGGQVVTIRSDTYVKAKDAAAKALRATERAG